MLRMLWQLKTSIPVEKWMCTMEQDPSFSGNSLRFAIIRALFTCLTV